MKNNQLLNGSLIFFLFIICALIFSKITHKVKGYGASNTSVLMDINQKKYLMNYLELSEVLSKENKGFLFIDLRIPETFKIQHLKDAVNIPFSKLFEKENINEIHRSNKIKVVYADSQDKSALALLMLKSLGVDNVRMLPGNYDIMYNNVISKTNPSYYFYSDEKAGWDYKRQMGGVTAKAEQNSAKIPQQIEIKPAVKGGC